MSPVKERYSHLAPLSIELRTILASHAVHFFSPGSYQENCAVIEKEPDSEATRPLDAYEFTKYLKNKGILNDPLKYTERIRQLLDRMAATGVLIELGHGSHVMLPKHYYFLKELSTLQKAGIFWLAPALGDDFSYYLAAPAIVHITGIDQDGDVCAGTGIIFAPHYVLTCAHVVEDMKVDKQQVLQGVRCRINKCFPHPKVDVAVIHIDQPLKPVPGLSFLPPKVTQPVFTLGYPKIPFAREAALTIQRGEVTNESVTTLDGHQVFLYSAIARPGNSGGPIVSGDGYIVGISMQDLSQQDKGNAFSPHYAGIPAHKIAECLNDLDVDTQIPIEDFN